jgi:hypothetical protein
LSEGVRLTVRVESDAVILREATIGSWREWEGRLKGADFLGDLARKEQEDRRLG